MTKKIVLIAFLISSSGLAQWLPSGATSVPIYYNGGNVGIGTSTPQNQFHLFRTTGSTIATLQSDTAALSLFTDSSFGPAIYGKAGQAIRFGFSTDGVSADGFSERLRITPEALLIGRTVPQADFDLLDIYSPSSVSVYLRGAGTGAEHTGIRFGNDVGDDQFVAFLAGSGYTFNGGPQSFTYYMRGNFPQVFFTNSIERMRIAGDGRVGIGTSAPAVTFHVIATPGLAAASFDGFGAANVGPIVTCRNADGTAAAPTATKANAVLCNFNGRGYGTTAYSSRRASMIFYASQDWSDTAQGSYLVLETTPSGTSGPVERLRITDSGAVSIGTATPTPGSKLHVEGDVTVSGNIAAKYQDLAEWVPSTDDLAPGTVVVLDDQRDNHVVASSLSYDTRVAGVVSGQPGIILGEAGDGKLTIATTGRVRIRVDATGSPVKRGDLLVSGERPGTAMRSEPVLIGGRPIHQPGTIIGKALEPLDSGVAEILVLLSMQ